MISDKLSQALSKQITSEFTASQQYLGIAVYFGQQSLDGWADFFYRQSEEEREHGLKIVRYLVDVEAEFELEPLGKATPQFASPVEAVRAALSWERQVTSQFHEMAELALEEKDYTTFQFLQWYLSEQIEEEATMQKLIDLIESGVNLFLAENHLPS
jgi:ferritin